MLSQNLLKHEMKKIETNQTCSKQTAEATSLMRRDWQIESTDTRPCIVQDSGTNPQLQDLGR